MERPESLPLLGFRRRVKQHVCPVSSPVRRVCRDRAFKRWSALLTQTTSRIAKKMRKRIGEANWASFVAYAEAEHKDAFFRTLTPESGVLRCEGALEGCPCPKEVEVNLKSMSSVECEESLPKDTPRPHTRRDPICQVWSKAWPKEPKSWDDGVCGPLIAHLLFGTEDHLLSQCSKRSIWKRQIVPRCGDVRGVEGQTADQFCHDVAMAHIDYTLKVEDIQWPK